MVILAVEDRKAAEIVILKVTDVSYFKFQRGNNQIVFYNQKRDTLDGSERRFCLIISSAFLRIEVHLIVVFGLFLQL